MKEIFVERFRALMFDLARDLGEHDGVVPPGRIHVHAAAGQLAYIAAQVRSDVLRDLPKLIAPTAPVPESAKPPAAPAASPQASEAPAPAKDAPKPEKAPDAPPPAPAAAVSADEKAA